ncbi:ArsR/SmtB family transcription factor [Ornithinicoccus halotolerans]|uniref:ArsR/SmtB family transcription factor n=1 Tax=Ornithinicoccus halotolerans TaxID=1748220 RepID=UPI001297A525|nr:metalloregulator ArsR/SmtB family transcription factor [Ornithinicoccus halotolerans]
MSPRLASPEPSAGRCGPADATDTDLELTPATHEFLKALASPSRQAVMMLFARGAELSVGEVAEKAGLGQSTASQQLAFLRRAGIVTSRRQGKVVLYRANRDGVMAALDDLQTYLLACC